MLLSEMSRKEYFLQLKRDRFSILFLFQNFLGIITEKHYSHAEVNHPSFIISINILCHDLYCDLLPEIACNDMTTGNLTRSSCNLFLAKKQRTRNY